MQRRFTLKALTAAVALSSLAAVPAYAADTIKVGILHSLSGTMAISETVLKDTVLMAIDEINAKGGEAFLNSQPVNGQFSPEEIKTLINASVRINITGAADGDTHSISVAAATPDVGRSAFTSARKVGAPALPFGAAQK